MAWNIEVIELFTQRWSCLFAGYYCFSHEVSIFKEIPKFLIGLFNISEALTRVSNWKVPSWMSCTSGKVREADVANSSLKISIRSSRTSGSQNSLHNALAPVEKTQVFIKLSQTTRGYCQINIYRISNPKVNCIHWHPSAHAGYRYIQRDWWVL